jgi:hypothetical protein
MALGYETQVVNGRMVNVAPGQAYAPLTFGSAYTGPGRWPRGGVYNVPPVAPSPGTWEGSMTDFTGSGGYPGPTAGTIDQNGKPNFFHPTKSPLLFAILFLAGGLAMLRYIHYA